MSDELIPVRRKKPKPKVPSKYPGELKRVMFLYMAIYRQKFHRPPIVGGRDWAMLKRLIETYTPILVEERLRFFMQSADEFLQRAGYTIGVFHARWMSFDAVFQKRGGSTCQCDPKCLTPAAHTRKMTAALKADPTLPPFSHIISKPKGGS